MLSSIKYHKLVNWRNFPPSLPQIRTEYLSLAQLIIKNSDYAEHQHKRAELQSCFNKIGQEEDIESQMDRLIVIEIWKDASQMFPRPKRT